MRVKRYIHVSDGRVGELIGETDNSKILFIDGEQKEFKNTTLRRFWREKEVEVVETSVTIPTTVNQSETTVTTKKKTGGRKKIDDETYIKIVEDYLKGLYPSKKAIAEKFNVSVATINEMFMPNQCRKSVREKVEQIKALYRN